MQINFGSMTTTKDGKHVVSGVASGWDTEKMLADIRNLKESNSITPIVDEIDLKNDKIAAYTNLKSSLKNLQSAADELRNIDNFDAFYKFTGDTTYATVSATGVPGVTSFDIEVENLAVVEKNRSISLSSNTSDITQVAGDHTDLTQFTEGTFQINGIDIDLVAGDTLQEIATKINNTTDTSNVSAAVIKISASDYRLTISSTIPGISNAFTFTDANNVTNAVLSAKYNVSATTFADPDVDVTQAGHGNSDLFTTGTFSINGQNVTVSGGDTLNIIAANINAVRATSGVAALVTDIGGGNYKLQLIQDPGTTPEYALVDGSNVFNSILGVDQTNPDLILQAAEDGQIKFDGISLTRSTNTMDDIVDGLSIQLNKENTPGEFTSYTVSSNKDNVTSLVADLVETYNAVLDLADDLGSHGDSNGEDTGVLNYEELLEAIRNEIITHMMGAVNIHSDYDLPSLRLLGIAYKDFSSNKVDIQGESQAYSGLTLEEVIDTKLDNLLEVLSFTIRNNSVNLSLLYSDIVISDQLIDGFGIVNEFDFDIDIGRATDDIIRVTYDYGSGPTVINMTFNPNNPSDLTQGGKFVGNTSTILDGVSLTYTGNGLESGMKVNVTQGVAHKLYHTIAQFNKTNGYEQRYNIDKRIKELMEEQRDLLIEQLEVQEKIDYEINRERKIYSRLESAVAEANAQLYKIEMMGNLLSN
jgi:flagellar hook-associated protein 2